MKVFDPGKKRVESQSHSNNGSVGHLSQLTLLYVGFKLSVRKFV